MLSSKWLSCNCSLESRRGFIVSILVLFFVIFLIPDSEIKALCLNKLSWCNCWKNLSVTILGKLRFLGLTHWITLAPRYFSLWNVWQFFSQAKITLVQIESCPYSMLWLSQTAHESPASHGCVLTNPLRISHMQILSPSHIAAFVTNALNDTIAKGGHSSCPARAKHRLKFPSFCLYYMATHQHQFLAFY